MSAHPTQPATPAKLSDYHLSPEGREAIRRRAAEIREALHWRRAQRQAAQELADLQRTLQPAANAATAHIPHHWPQVTAPYPGRRAPNPFTTTPLAHLEAQHHTVGARMAAHQERSHVQP